MSETTRGALWWLWLAALVVALDRGTKLWAVASLELHRPVVVLPWLNLTLTHNTGAAFSLLSDAGGWQRWLFVVLAIAISGALVVWMSRLGSGERMLAAALALVIGGALGNLWDRVVHGAVVDFVDLHLHGLHWPAFNVADSAITIGVVLLGLGALRERD